MMLTGFVLFLTGSIVAFGSSDTALSNKSDQKFNGKYFSGEGDLEYLQLLDTAYRLYYPDPEIQNISMLYAPSWNGFVEGPTWGAWWIQNSYGPSYCALPFLLEPYTTFLQNAQDLWFNQMGDGIRKGANDWVAPDGCLCDAAAPGWIVYKQGDGRIDIHDWGMEFTAAGVVLQAELLLISRDMEAIKHYLPMLERSANFVETRRDPKNNLFLAGPAGNLLAPSYAGWHKPDGSYDKAYLTGLSVNYIAGLNRLIELEKMVGDTDKANMYTKRRDLAKEGLPALMTDEGYFIKYMDPDGTKHGVYGAEKHGYFEAICNHDAIAFRVADDMQAKKIYDKIASIPDLRRNDVIINNCPSLDDMYTKPEGLWAFGNWVNGGHWTTCEARMILGYYRLGKYDDARKSMKHILKFAKIFRMDNNLTNFGANVYQPNEPINCVYDTWGAPSAFIRGLFEYLYGADGLALIPHIPEGIKRLRQNFPIRFGNKRLYLATEGIGEVTSVWINGKQWETFDGKSVFLPYDKTPDIAQITICMGNASPQESYIPEQASIKAIPPPESKFWVISDIESPSPNIPINDKPLKIGANSNGGDQFVGDIYGVQIYNRALSEDEVKALAKNPSMMIENDKSIVVNLTFDHEENGYYANKANSDLPAKIVGEIKPINTEYGNAIKFTGNGYLEVKSDSRLRLSEAYTLAVWIRPEKFPQNGSRIIDRITAGKNDGYLLDTCPENSLRLMAQRWGIGFDAKLTAGEWAYVIGTFDIDGEIRLYLNGKSVASNSAKSRGAVSEDIIPLAKVGAFYARLCDLGLSETYEAKHARLIVDYVEAIHARAKMKSEGKIYILPPISQYAADKSYVDSANRLAQGLRIVMESYGQSDDLHKKRLYAIWQESFK